MTAEVNQIIESACRQAFNLSDVEALCEPVEAKYGDYATNVALRLARGLKMTPTEVATKIVAAINHQAVAKAEVAGPGFINLTMQASWWGERLHEITDQYGAADLGKHKKVQVEFISANPTGPATVGNARGGYIGDVIARVLELTKHQVTREYYFNDGGTQIKKLGGSIKAAAGLPSDEEQYQGEYVTELVKKLKPTAKDSDEDVGARATELVFADYIKPAVAKMGIKFDVWFNEKSLMTSGQLASSIERLKEAGLVYEKDGAVWVGTEKLGDNQDRVLMKSNGDPTYLGNDIPYHINIFDQRGFDVAIKVWGADHAANMRSLGLVMQKLFPKKSLVFVINQFVRLVKDGKEYRVSKRAGNFVTIEELIDLVGADVTRFFFLMHSADSHMDFDLNLAREQSQKNPFWYVMYSFARANSILKQADKRRYKPGAALSEPNAVERALIKQMVQWPELIAQMAQDYGVHRLTFFGMEIARRFHDYYESERIIDLGEAEASAKLYLVEQYITFMRVYFRTLGIEPRSEM